MKKLSTILIFVLLFINFLVMAYAQELGESGLPPELEKIQQAGEKISTEEARTSYLKQEWGKMLEKTAVFGPIIKIFNAVMTALNPLFKAILGVEYSLSWAFVFAVIIWLILFFILLPAMSALIGKPIPAIIAAFAVTSLIGLSGVIKKTVEILVVAVTKPWIAIASLVISIIILVVIIKFGKVWKEYKEEEAKRQEEEHRKILEITAEIEKKKLEEEKK